MNVANGPSVKPFLMFSGNAKEAMDFYVDLVDNSEIIELSLYGEDEAGKAGSVKQGVFSLSGQEIMCIDSPVEHGSASRQRFRCSCRGQMRSE